MIALQYCVGFCHTSTWIGHRYASVPSLYNLPPPSHPPHPSWLSQRTGLRSLSHAGNSLWLSVLCMVMHTFPCYLCPTFSSPCCVHISFSMSASPLLPWKICSSTPSFWIPYICVNIWYLFFQLTSVFFFLILRDYHNSKLKGGIYHTLNKEVNS